MRVSRRDESNLGKGEGMGDEVDPDAGSLHLETFSQVVAICDRFEAEWRAGADPRIEDYLSSTALRHELRSVLLRELLQIELELREEEGVRPGVAGYLARFPDDAAMVLEVFESGSQTQEHLGRQPHPVQEGPSRESQTLGSSRDSGTRAGQHAIDPNQQRDQALAAHAELQAEIRFWRALSLVLGLSLLALGGGLVLILQRG